MPLTDRIEFPDPDNEDRDFMIDVRVWKGKDQGLVALDPVDAKSHAFAAQSRALIRLLIQSKYGIRDFVVYESQFNGFYTPTKPTKLLHHGASLNEASLVRFGQHLEGKAWRHSQELHKHRLPPPTPHTEWPIDR